VNSHLLSRRSLSFGPRERCTRASGSHTTAFAVCSGSSPSEGGRFAASLRVAQSRVRQIPGRRPTVRTLHSRAGNEGAFYICTCSVTAPKLPLRATQFDLYDVLDVRRDPCTIVANEQTENAPTSLPGGTQEFLSIRQVLVCKDYGHPGTVQRIDVRRPFQRTHGSTFEIESLSRGGNGKILRP
jgi:hypothetical protein